MNGILARKNVERLRTEEMEFLGMSRKKKTPEEERNDPVKKMEETRKERKLVQENNWKRYQDAKVEMKEEIEYNQGTDIMEDMLQQRRDWINEQKAMNGNKVPDDIKPFYDRFNTETPTSPEEEAARAAEEAEEGGKKKKKGDKKAKKAKGKKGKKDDGDDKPQVIKIGTSEVVTKFDDFYDEWKNDWDQKDEANNQEQKHDEEKTRDDVMPSIEDQLKNDVDEMIKMELENMRTLSGVKQKKKKGKKKGKKKKKKKKKGLKLPGYKQIKDMNVKEILVTLINNNIVKKIPPQKLTDFMGEFNYIHTMLDDITKIPYDPSMALIRQLVTEYIIFPLGSELVRLRFPEDVSSYLFYGPAGTGKTLVVRAIVHETNSIFFDMSPINIDGKYTGKKEEEKLVASVMIVAQEYQPSVIYIDEAEKVWAAKKKGKKGKGAKKKKSDPSNPARIKKAMLKWKAKFITDKTRITIIGCTSEPEEGSKKEFKKFFKRAIYFPFPDYSTRRLMWKNFIMTYKGQIRADFPLSTLAHISAGYSAGSIKKTCEKVLTEYRVKHQEQRPLSLPEFIGPLSLCSNTMDSQYAEFQEFTKNITGFKPPAEDGGGGDEKAPKKKKKGKK
jgi:SpoVK/Ycf46/Vps4 family AAA+-type ATPase